MRRGYQRSVLRLVPDVELEPEPDYEQLLPSIEAQIASTEARLDRARAEGDAIGIQFHEQWAIDERSMLEYVRTQAAEERHRGLTATLTLRDGTTAVVFIRHPDHAVSLPVQEAIEVGEFEGERYFAYGESLYRTAERLTAEDVTALMAEDERRKRRRLEKAHAVAAMERSVDARAKRQPIPQDVRVLVWQRDEGRCAECGSNHNLEYDHIIPLSMGGSIPTETCSSFAQTAIALRAPHSDEAPFSVSAGTRHFESMCENALRHERQRRPGADQAAPSDDKRQQLDRVEGSTLAVPTQTHGKQNPEMTRPALRQLQRPRAVG